MTTLRELLQLPRFSEIQLINSEAHLDIPVTTIEITETPDVALYIPKNVLILSTAMVFKDKQEDLIPFIDSLIKANAVGLGIKISRFLKEINPKIIAYANEKKFALITIPDAYPLGSLLHQMQNFLWDTKEEEINYAMDIQRTFSDLVIGDATLPHFTNELGKFIKTPVLLLDPFFKPLAHSRHFHHALAKEEHLVNEILQYTKGVQTEQESFIVKTINGNDIHIAVYPIKVFSYFPHYLVIVSPEKVPFPISSFAIEQAALVLAFVLFKNMKVQESAQRLHNGIYKKIIENKSAVLSKTDTELLNMGNSLRLIDGNYHQVILIKHSLNDAKDTKIKYTEEIRQLTLLWFQNRLGDILTYSPIVFPNTNNNIIFLLQEQIEELEIKLDTIASELEAILPITITFSFGSVYDSFEKISDSFIEAEIAQSTTKQMVVVPRINHFRAQGLKQLFSPDDKETIYYFATSILKELAYPIEEPLLELQKTLKSYLDNQSQITKTAEDLFIHRNTVKYRIERCEEILGKKLINPTVSLNVRLALELVSLDK